MTGTLHVLCEQGDVTLEWNADDPESVARARAEVLALKTSGFTFFVVDGTPADEIAAGRGALKARRVEAEELLPPDAVAVAAAGDETETAEGAPRRRGRPRKDESVTAIATRPLRGG